MFKPNHLYPLKDTDTYGPRYRFALTLSEPISPQCWVLDGWIADQHGNKHPGVDSVPVPVRRDSVFISKGVPCAIEYKPAAFCGWR